jgi:hypothetical protein
MQHPFANYSQPRTESCRPVRHTVRMWRHPFLKLLLAVYIGWGAWNWFTNRPVNAPDGVLAPAEPVQIDMPSGQKVSLARWTLTVRASYQVTARVLGVERYHFDTLANLVPEDLALVWGPMSDNRVLAALDISQSHRFYYWRLVKGSGIPREMVIVHSANTHVIPENALIARQLSHLRRGQVVTLTGDLVDGARDDGAWIRTSMVRTDTGAGACEVMLVHDIAVLK